MHTKTLFHIFLLILMSSMSSLLLIADDVDNEVILRKQSTDTSYDIKERLDSLARRLAIRLRVIDSEQKKKLKA